MTQTTPTLTTEQIEKIATNYLLSVSEKLQIVKITKVEETFSGNGRPMLSVNVRVLNFLGKKTTEKVYIQSEHDYVGGYNFKHKKVSEMLDMDLLTNPEFTQSFEEAIAEQAKKQEQAKFENLVFEISRELNYNLKQHRSVAVAKRSYKKYTQEEIESVMERLTPVHQNYLLQIVDALNQESKPKQTVKEYIASFFGAKRELFSQIEKTFELNEKRIFENTIKWLKDNKDTSHLPEAKLQEITNDYIENQKWNLFKTVGKYLNDLDIVSTENTYFSNQKNGFEGTWIITLKDGSKKTFTTHTIVAEGYIQRAHYRYLVNLK